MAKIQSGTTPTEQCWALASDTIPSTYGTSDRLRHQINSLDQPPVESIGPIAPVHRSLPAIRPATIGHRRDVCK